MKKKRIRLNKTPKRVTYAARILGLLTPDADANKSVFEFLDPFRYMDTIDTEHLTAHLKRGMDVVLLAQDPTDCFLMDSINQDITIARILTPNKNIAAKTAQTIVSTLRHAIVSANAAGAEVG